MTIVNKATKIIFANEGGYTSVNANDNGAVSIGRCQWHGDRAKKLLQSIVTVNLTDSQKILGAELLDDILDIPSWCSRIVNSKEKAKLELLLATSRSKKAQDELAKKDVQGYINHIMSHDITDSKSIIFLADIQNQGGEGGVNRIIETTFATCGKYATINDFMKTALNDRVFKNYRQRRYNVYKEVCGHEYGKSVKVTPVTTKKDYVGYVVKHGDCLSSIAYKYGTTVAKLREWNDIKDANLIKVGQVLKIRR